MRALDDAVRAGKILYLGISDAPAWVLTRANTLAEWRGWTSFAGLQVPYNLLNRDIERELLPMAETCGMTMATRGPLAHGLLSGKLTRPGADTGSVGARERAVAGLFRISPTSWASPPRRWRSPGPGRGPERSTRSLARGPPSSSRTTWVPSTSRCPRTRCNAWGRPRSSPSDSPAKFIAQASSWVFGEVSSRLDGR